jgi:hypothetical protein
MLRNLRALGLTIVAALAISAVGASTASAAPQFHFETEHTIITGMQITGNELTFDSGKVKCGVAKFGGTSAVFTTTTMTLTPTFENCKIKKGEAEAEATITHNGCAFVFHLGTNTEHLTGTMGIECPDFPIEIDAPECTITVPEQGNLGTVTYKNEGEETTRSVIFDMNLSGIHYVEHGAGCENETETTNNGSYTGQITVTGENTLGAHRGIWIE